MQFPISVDDIQLAALCRRWKVVEMSLFGSAAKGTARPESDVDILVSFSPEADWGLLDHVAMEQEMSELLNRKVDLVSRRAIERSSNSIRRQSILDNTVPIYIAGQSAGS